MKLRTNPNNKTPVTNPKYQYYATITATSCLMISGMHYGWPSPSIPRLLDGSSPPTITNEEGSWIAVMPLIGSVIGALTAGPLLDSVGRKKTILATALPYVASWLMIAFCINIEMMYTARFIAGLADGFAFTAVPVYVGEIADADIRGLLGSSCSVLMILGILVINGLGLYLSIFTTALISTALPIIFLMTFLFMPESPYYLIMKDNYEGAKSNLKILKGIEDVDLEVNRLTNAVKKQASETGKFWDLFTVASNRKAVLITVGLRTVQQLCGIAAITFYTKMIFQEGGEDISAEVTTIIYYSVQFVLTCMSSLIIDRVGRRPLMIISTVGTAVALMVEGAYFYLETETTFDVAQFNYIPVIALIMFIVTYSIGMCTIPLLMLGELFPTNVKAFALSLSDIYFSIIAAIVSKFFQIMKDNFGMYVPFFSFAICCILGVFFVIVVLPETKGKTLEEIQDILKGIERVDDDGEDDKSDKVRI